MDVYQWERGFTHDELVEVIKEVIKDAGRTYARIQWLLDHPQIDSLANHSVIHALEATLELCGGPTRADGERWSMVIDGEMGLEDVEARRVATPARRTHLVSVYGVHPHTRVGVVVPPEAVGRLSSTSVYSVAGWGPD